MSRDMICVYHAADVEQAEVLVTWLAERGIEALVKDSYAATMMPSPLIVAPQGIEVCVMDPEQAERARVLLREQFAEASARHASDTADATVEATCEECGRSARFPASQRGTVQTCPHCGRYVDVPPT
jgi:hypothetical protein